MSDTIEKKIESILKRINPEFEYRDDVHLRENLDLDSLDVIEFLFEIETQLQVKVPEEDIDERGLLVLGNLCNYVKEKLTETN